MQVEAAKKERAKAKVEMDEKRKNARDRFKIGVNKVKAVNCGAGREVFAGPAGKYLEGDGGGGGGGVADESGGNGHGKSQNRGGWGRKSGKDKDRIAKHYRRSERKKERGDQHKNWKGSKKKRKNGGDGDHPFGLPEEVAVAAVEAEEEHEEEEEEEEEEESSSSSEDEGPEKPPEVAFVGELVVALP